MAIKSGISSPAVERLASAMARIRYRRGSANRRASARGSRRRRSRRRPSRPGSRRRCRYRRPRLTISVMRLLEAIGAKQEIQASRDTRRRETHGRAFASRLVPRADWPRERARRGAVARKLEQRLGVGDRQREAAGVDVEVEHVVGELGRDLPLVLSTTSDLPPKEQAWGSRARRRAGGGHVSNGQCTAYAANIAVGHQAGRHHRVEHALEFITEVERHRGNAHRRADSGRRLAGPLRGHAPLERGEHVAETSPDSAMRAEKAALGSQQAQVELGQPLRFHSARSPAGRRLSPAPAGCRRCTSPAAASGMACVFHAWTPST